MCNFAQRQVDHFREEQQDNQRQQEQDDQRDIRDIQEWIARGFQLRHWCVDNNIAFDLVIWSNGSKGWNHVFVKHAEKVADCVEWAAGNGWTKIWNCGGIFNVRLWAGIQDDKSGRVYNPNGRVHKRSDCINLPPHGFQRNFVIIKVSRVGVGNEQRFFVKRVRAFPLHVFKCHTWCKSCHHNKAKKGKDKICKDEFQI